VLLVEAAIEKKDKNVMHIVGWARCRKIWLYGQRGSWKDSLIECVYTYACESCHVAMCMKKKQSCWRQRHEQCSIILAAHIMLT
jgi:hypothetical protein